MKKIIALLLALTLALSLAACGSTDQTPSGSQPESSLTSDTNSDQEMESTTEPEGSTQEPETPAENAESTPAEQTGSNTAGSTQTSKPSGGSSSTSKPSSGSTTSKPSGGTTTSKPSGNTSSKPSQPEKPAQTEKSLSDLMTSILSGVETPGYAITELAAEQYPLYLFIDQPKGAQAVTADALIGSIAHSVVLMRLPDGSDVSGIAKSIKDNADPRKWICVEAEKVIVKTKGDLVLLVMSTTDIADAIAANFDALSV